MDGTETSPRIIKGIVDQYRDTLPVELAPIMKRLHLEAIETRQLRPKTLEGALSKEVGNYIIYVPKKADKGQRRFAIARGIGYMVEEPDVFQSFSNAEVSMTQDTPTMGPTDLRALKFADELLLPEEEFVRRSMLLRSDEKVASFFMVPQRAVFMRAIRLKRGYEQ